MIQVEKISFQYANSSQTVFENYTFNLDKGSTGIVVGDNGSGKSTLGKLLCGLTSPTTGKIRINNTDPFKLKPSERIKLAYYITQINQLQFVKSTLQDEIKCSEKLACRKAEQALYENFYLPDNKEYNPFELTTNQAWRFTVYLATIINPLILFIDEIPSAANRKNLEVLKYLLETRKANGQITILSYQRLINFNFDLVITIP